MCVHLPMPAMLRMTLIWFQMFCMLQWQTAVLKTLQLLVCFQFSDMSLQSGVAVPDLVTQGTGLVFIVYPEVFNVLGGIS